MVCRFIDELDFGRRNLPEMVSISRFAKIFRPVLDLLNDRGGFSFVVICLCLLSLTIGLFFHRSFYGVYFQKTEVAHFVQESGRQALIEIDEVLLAVSAAEMSGGVSKHEVKGAGQMAHRLRSLIGRAVDDLPAGRISEAPSAAARGTIGRIESLKSLLVEIGSKSNSNETTSTVYRRLIAELRATRTAYLLFLDEMSLAEERLGRRWQSRFAILIGWFWAFLVFSAAAGAVFFRLLRDEVSGRIAREKAERRADYLAYFDPATGLSNRFQFQDRLTGWMALGHAFAVLHVDIDEFRSFNDRFGRLSGDVVLKEVAFRLRKRADSLGGFAARLAGDDFAVAVPENDETRLVDISKEIAEFCRSPVSRAGQSLAVSVSIGVVPCGAMERKELSGYEGLMRTADFALESAKRKGGGAIEIFGAELARRFVDRRTMAERLPQAIAEKNLQIFLQPQCELNAGRVFGFEALARWFLNGVAVPAPELVKVAEEEGIIGDLDRYMLRESVRILATWNRSHRSSFSVSVNVSALHLTSNEIVDHVRACLAHNDLPAHLLTIEITESVELDHNGSAAQVIQELRSLGCRVSIDDFGTGYSSLGYLREIDFDEIKIDRAFVSDIAASEQAREFLASVLQLPRCLGRRVVVEGIETDEQKEIARSLGAEFIQGYLVGKPRPAMEWLAESTYFRRCAAGDASGSFAIPA